MTSPLLILTRVAGRIAAAVGRHKALAQGVAGAIAVGLGLWGWTIHAPPGDLAGWFNNIFRTAQLITLQFPTALDTGIPWQLQVARLLVPLVAVLATFHVFVGAVTRPVRLMSLSRARDHIVVHGAEQMTRAALERLAARGRRIVAVQPGIDVGRRESLEGLGLTIVEAAPDEPATLAALGLRTAAAFLVTGEGDLDNLNLAVRALDEVKGRPADLPPLVLGVLIDDEVLAGELDAALDGVSRAAGVRYHRLCPDRDGLRLDLRRFAPVFTKADRATPSHVLVVGLAGRWAQVLMQLVVACQDHPDERPVISLVLDEAEAKAFAAWRAGRPDLDLVARFEVLAKGPGLLPAADVVEAWRAAFGSPHLGVVMRADAEAVSVALALRRPGTPFGTEAVPVLVRQGREDHLLSRLGGAEVRDRKLSDVVAFGGLIRAEAIERVLDRKGDAAAMAMHAHYVEALRGQPVTSPAMLAAWDELPENLRDANRAAAEHAPVLFASAGLRLAEGEGAAHALSSDEIERLARVEHRRWIADRIDRGWRSGPKRDNARLIHPSMVAFDALSGLDQEKDRTAVRALVEILSRAGIRVVKG